MFCVQNNRRKKGELRPKTKGYVTTAIYCATKWRECGEGGSNGKIDQY